MRAAPMLLGDSAAMRLLRSQIELVAARNCTVLIHGETGAGKELVARAIHGCSRRGDKPILPVDCTGLHDTLFDSQLFGHVRIGFAHEFQRKAEEAVAHQKHAAVQARAAQAVELQRQYIDDSEE